MGRCDSGCYLCATETVIKAEVHQQDERKEGLGSLLFCEYGTSQRMGQEDRE